MYITAQDGTVIISTLFPIKVVRADEIDFVATDPAMYAGFLVVSLIGDDDVEILGSYQSKEDAVFAIKDIARAMAKGVTTYQMPSSMALNKRKETYGITVSIN